ncbi:metal-dependent hydrolase [Erysipelothrix sp. HDW6C]|uniref:MBL fold metallo-hydrolase n=1 Tax=Erysipelothrix sp. HDW6C TaxID=2714930 RepID=UPI00140A876E|nr:metal-dependent hydrolase [Erysipelothrix sp. HDW6C]QIK70482.1 metal-dependent hydrolase [Erysipelothrix sp. HDW6C]
MLNVEYINHCGYIVETDNAVYVFDYVEGQVPARYLMSHKPTYFFVTTAESHHYTDAIFSYRKPVFLSYDVLASPFNNVYKMDVGDTFHTGFATIHVLKTTREGVCYLIKEKDKTILHGGDLNNWHWSSMSNKQEINEEETAYELALEQFQNIGKIDVMMFSIDPRMGEDYDKGARRIVELLRPQFFFPMHFGDNSSDLNEFYEWSNGVEDCKFFKPNYTNHTFKNIA